jgi:hypothetical protein
MRDILDLLFRIQQRRKIDLLIIGAWALQVHGYSRITHGKLQLAPCLPLS